MDETEERRRAQKIQDRYHARAKEIRASADLSLEGKQRQLALVYKESRAQLDQLRVAEQTRLERRYAELERRLHGLDGKLSGADAISARDALDRALQLKTPEEAHALLARAEATGDDSLARAVASVASSRSFSDDLGANGWDDVTRHYVDARPSMQPVVEELAQIERLSKRQAFSAFSLVPPSEVPPRVMNSTTVDNVMPAVAVTV